MSKDEIKELVDSNLHLNINEARKFFFKKSRNNEELYVNLMTQWRKNKNKNNKERQNDTCNSKY